MLMIIFHLTYIEHLYPGTKRFIYTFHMPVFLVISGYFLNTEKNIISFFKTMFWIFFPYAFIECAYTIMASLLPIKEHVDYLSASLIIKNIFISPIGPYWYLHTLVICGITYYMVFNYVKIKNISRFIIIALCFYFYAHYLGLLSFYCACYFIAGTVIRKSNLNFLDVIRPSVFAIIPIILIAIYPKNLNMSTIGGVTIVYLVMSLCLFFFTREIFKINSFYWKEHINITYILPYIHNPGKSIFTLSDL